MFMNFINKHSSLITVSFYVIGIFVLSFFIFKNMSITNDIKQVQKIAEHIENKTVLDDQENKDSDGDGLADWEEVLYKTNSYVADSDGDGISDGDEVASNRSPSIFGIGSLSQVDKLISTSENVLTLQEQRLIWDQAYEKRKTEEEEIQRISQKVEKTPEELEYLAFKEASKDTIFRDINKAGLVMKNNDFDISVTYGAFNKLFIFPFPNSGENTKAFAESENIDIPKIPEYSELSDTDMRHIETFILQYGVIGKELSKVSINDSYLKRIMNNLANNYLLMSESIAEMSVLVEKGDRSVNQMDIIDQYTNNLTFLTKNRGYINDFLVFNEIPLGDGDPGSFFLFSF